MHSLRNLLSWVRHWRMADLGGMGTTVEGSGSVIPGTNTGFPIYTPNNQAHGFVYVCEYACLRYFFFLF